MKRYVFDPGVLIAGLISPRGAPAGLLLEWLDGGFELVVCPHLLDELERVLARPKFEKYLDENQVSGFLGLLGRLAIVVLDPTDIDPVTPDPDDDYLVALAQEAGADAVISGDGHLSDVDVIQVLSPRVLHEALGL